MSLRFYITALLHYCTYCTYCTIALLYDYTLCYNTIL